MLNIIKSTGATNTVYVNKGTKITLTRVLAHARSLYLTRD